MDRYTIIHDRVRDLHGEDSAIMGDGGIWLSGSQRFLTAEEVAAVMPSEIEVQTDRVRKAIDSHVEAQARALGYNSAAHLAGYATSTVPQWAAEAAAFVVWRDAVWLAVFAAMDGEPDLSDIPALIAKLPVWKSP
jgi:6-phosphofructokinase